jgi:VanZ family protein
MQQPVFRPRPVLSVLGGYTAAVGVIAFWPTPVDRPISALLRRVLNRLHDVGVPAWFDYSFVEFSANVLLFVPLGFLVAALFSRRLAWLAVVVCALASLSIEFVQWALLPARYPSAADVLANTMGATIGALLLALVLAIRPRPRVA